MEVAVGSGELTICRLFASVRRGNDPSMAIEKKTIRLLILEDSQNEAERLVSLFRNAGHATRVHRLISSDDLAEALQQTWDLLICAPSLSLIHI